MSAEGAAAFVKQLRDNDYLEEELLKAEAEIKTLRETIKRLTPPTGLAVLKYKNSREHRFAFFVDDSFTKDHAVVLRNLIADGDPRSHVTQDELDQWALRNLPIVEV